MHGRISYFSSGFPDSLYFLVSGRLRHIVQDSIDTIIFSLPFMKSAYCWFSLFPAGSPCETLSAAEDSVLLKLTKASFDSILHKYPEDHACLSQFCFPSDLWPIISSQNYIQLPKNTKEIRSFILHLCSLATTYFIDPCKSLPFIPSEDTLYFIADNSRDDFAALITISDLEGLPSHNNRPFKSSLPKFLHYLINLIL